MIVTLVQLNSSTPITNNLHNKKNFIIPKSPLHPATLKNIGNFPHTTTIEGDLINIVLPVVGSMKCDLCNDAYAGKNWTSAKGLLLRHIENIHKHPIKRVQIWCSSCQSSIHPKISLHRCFINNEIMINVPQHFTCNTCDFTSPSQVGITSHHVREAATNFQANERRRNAPQPTSHPSDDEPEPESKHILHSHQSKAHLLYRQCRTHNLTAITNWPMNSRMRMKQTPIIPSST